MKKGCILLITFCLLLSLAGCKDHTYFVDYGNSQIYTKEDMKFAIKAIMARFDRWEDPCRMIEIKYAGDEQATQENLDYCNRLSDGAHYDQCIIFESAFRTPKNTLVLNPNEIYTGYQWILARSGSGGWTVITCGYA